ncbi:hypothetical protein C2G38_2237220, partial [Gigaspora rosea]
KAPAAEIASWVDRKDNTYSVTNNPYKFKLILRGTRDGFTANSFWRLCNMQTPLVIVIKVKDTDEILVQNSILSRVIDPKHAILCFRNYGPHFGEGYDLAMWNNFNKDKNCWNKQMSYEKRIRNVTTYDNFNRSSFSVDEYEIFQISKKTFKYYNEK